MSDVSIILPTYNESKNIQSVINGLQAALPNAEIIIVDDDSPDGTAELVRSEYDSVRIHVRENETGLASAVVKGFELAAGDYFIVMDADGQHPPKDVAQLKEALENGADVAIGSRRVQGGENNADWGLKRHLISRGASLLAWLALPPTRQLNDPVSGFFGVNRTVVDPIIDEIDPRGYKILLGLLARCPVRYLSEIPFSFEDRTNGDSNLGIDEQLQYAIHIVELAYVYRTTPTIRKLSLPEVDYE